MKLNLKNIQKIGLLYYLAVLGMLFSNTSNAQTINHYVGWISLDSLRTVNATFDIDYTNGNKNDFYFYVNKNASIKRLISDNKPIDFEVKETVEDVKKITIKNTFPGKFVLNIAYSYPLDKIESKIFAYNPNWIELNLYTGWFPVNFDNKNYSYHINFKVPEGYEIIGNGVIRKNKAYTTIVNNNNHFDIPLVLTNRFQQFSSSNNKIKFYGVQLPRKKIEEIQKTSLEMYNFYKNKFGKSSTDKLVVTVNPFEHDMSYARKGFISISLLDNYGIIDRKVLSHEIAHLWWQSAKSRVWEDWLNESFAEFSTLKWIENSYPNEIFQNQLKRYEDAYKIPKKISQVKPGDENWHSIAYFKGPYILYQLEQKIGEQKMVEFLKDVYISRVSTTEKLLDVLKNYTNETTVNAFKNEIY
ncbi:hypothetical protein M2T82_00690 [Elizabethkingia ursingii]|uniref:M1 family aminopeptidase n=1 Tax=Elizabethkingia ursingii TaxID=1756150 RepID=UPI0020121D09|nr:M1 family aminopeptidase [Elizabethkingia ursingii]MCL1666570.1 hypothetical protein [Elizabethkingia ursingii]